MPKDAQGHSLTDATAEASALYDQAVRAYNLAYGDAMGGFNAAIAVAPKFAMAHRRQPRPTGCVRLDSDRGRRARRTARRRRVVGERTSDLASWQSH